ncbi:pPIWI-associating nuclease domain-containing protein [Labilibaculum euxinus]
MKESKLFEGIFDKYLETDFELNLLKACLTNLNQFGNDLRFNNYAYSLRELSRHLLKRLAPDENILLCSWYKNEIEGKANGITRNQRVKYAIQGGLSDTFIEEELDLDISGTKKKLKKAIDLLSKYTHVNEDTFAIDESTVNNHVSEINKAFSGLFTDIDACRQNIILRIEDGVDSAIIERTVYDVIEDIDEMSTHHEIEDVDYDIKVEKLNNLEILFKVSGSIDVLQQYGSSGDRRRGDGHEMRNSFPYECELGCPVNKLKDFEPKIERLNVNTDSFYE